MPTLPRVPGRWIDNITTNRDRDAWEAGDLADYFPGLPIHCHIQWYAARGETRLLFSFGIHGQNLFTDRLDKIVVAKVSSQALPLDTGRIELTMRAVSKIRSALGWDGGKTCRDSTTWTNSRALDCILCREPLAERSPGTAILGTCTFTMRGVVLFDLDSRIPNLALLKLSAYYKRRGFEVHLARQPSYLVADEYVASAIFYTALTKRKIDALRAIYGLDVDIGGSGIDLTKRLTPEAEACFPDYSL
ncbi:MAG: hypothetical protein EXQ58_03235 [Acidobacteria bacterium]|nr:hypothetical protein [Acidobacteriota bacterium]